jgi:hypothetical protein
MTKAERTAYQLGSRQVWELLLAECLKNLGEDAQDKHGWVSERARAVSALRNLCAEFGDNDWSDGLDLYDVIDKHLGAHLRAPGTALGDDARQTILTVIDLLDASRHAFRSKQVQDAREKLEGLLNDGPEPTSR